jgi:hypothetical protein
VTPQLFSVSKVSENDLTFRDDWSDDMSTKGTTAQLLIKLIAVACCVMFGISGCYIYLIPMLFHGYKTYSVLILGLLAAYLSGGYLGYDFLKAATLPRRILFGMACGICVAVLVLYCSMFMMLNMRGA